MVQDGVYGFSAILVDGFRIAGSDLAND